MSQVEGACMVEIQRQLQDKSVAEKLYVFGTREFLASKSTDHGWFLSKDFALPFWVDRSLAFRRLVFTTETICLREDLTVEAEKQFLDEIVGICERGKDIRVDLIATPQANAVFRAVPSGSECIAWGSYIVDLTKPETAIFDAFHAKHRNVIRKASADGVTITTTRDTALIYGSLKETMVRQRLLFFPSKSYLDELQRQLDDKITFYIALREAQLQGAAVVVHNQVGAFYYYGGSIEKPYTGSLNLMQYEIMRDLKRKNVPVYDLMGARITTGGDSKIEGIQRFKSRFASSMRRGYSFRRIIRPVKHRIFISAVKAYFALKGSQYHGDVIDQTRAFQLQTMNGDTP